MIAEPDTPRVFFFIIDGLDEFDGDSRELIDFVSGMAKYSYVKVCVASRPLLQFPDAFEECPRLHLEQLTKSDICKYITTYFAHNKH
jgi:hypothetical protein